MTSPSVHEWAASKRRQPTIYNLQIHYPQRCFDELDDTAREAMAIDLTSTIGYIFGMRDGSCYRYEKEIEAAVQAVQHKRISNESE